MVSTVMFFSRTLWIVFWCLLSRIGYGSRWFGIFCREVGLR